MKNFLAKISYDGTDFSCWQIQKEGRTVQQVLEDALYRVAKEVIKITSAGRTDAGVHAIGQYANFNFPIQMTAKQIQLALRANLPYDIQVTKIIEEHTGQRRLVEFFRSFAQERHIFAPHLQT